MDRGRPGFPRDFTCPVVLELQRLAGQPRPTGLSPALVRRSSRFGRHHPCQWRRSSSSHAGSQPQPRNACSLGTVLVSAGPVSLATTPGVLSLPRGTKMVQFPRFPPQGTLGVRTFSACGGCPIRRRWDRRLTAAPPAYRCWSASFIGWSCRGILRPRIMSCLVMDHSAGVGSAHAVVFGSVRSNGTYTPSLASPWTLAGRRSIADRSPQRLNLATYELGKVLRAALPL